MEGKYSGMTVTERLYHSSALENYDKAVEEKNIDEIRNILEALGVGEAEICQVVCPLRDDFQSGK